MKVLMIVLGMGLTQTCRAIPIDNGVDGEPEIECGPTSITANFNTQQNFEGHVFVKGRFADQQCINSVVGSKVAGIALPFDTCGVNRRRSENPKGIFVDIVIIITFHPKFITKVDRAYKLQCFYMEADKTVSTEIEVSMLTTAFRSEVVPMPVCRYELLNGGPSGPIVQYALIGQQIYHKWICDTETVNTFCMIVYSCYVDDGNGDTVDLINEDGCALDGNLISNLEYQSDLMAGQEAHVFKYADRTNLYFNCQIQITVKEPKADCKRPTCPEPQRTLGRKKRSEGESELSKRSVSEHFAIVDVSTEGLQVLDLDSDTPVLPAILADAVRQQQSQHTNSVSPLSNVHGSAAEEPSPAICLSTSSLGLTVSFLIVLIGATLTSAFYCTTRDAKRKQ